MPALRRSATSPVVVGVLLAAGGGLLAMAMLQRFGLMAVVGAGLLGIGLLLLDRPGLLFGMVAVLTGFCQFRAAGLLGFTGRFFEPAILISPFEALLMLLAASAFMDGVRRGRLRAPDPFTIPLVIAAVAMVAGTLVGLSNGASFGDVRTVLRVLAVALIMPFVVANVVHGARELRRVLTVGAGLAIGIAIIGLVSAALGRGQNEFQGAATTFYVPTPMWLILIFLLGVLAALLMRVRLPIWVLLGAPVGVLALVLSYHRGFWIGSVVGAVVVIVAASGPLGRRLLVPGVAAVGVAVWLTVSAGVTVQLQGPLGERLESLQSSRIENNIHDRYRIGERRNALADIKENPITGLGIGIPWTARYGLSVEHPNGRAYVHIAALWWWLKLGIVGVLSYALLLATGVLTANRLRAAARDPYVRAVGAALMGAYVGLAVTEITATYTGTDPAFTFFLAVSWGVAAVARRELIPLRAPAREPAATRPPAEAGPVPLAR